MNINQMITMHAALGERDAEITRLRATLAERNAELTKWKATLVAACDNDLPVEPTSYMMEQTFAGRDAALVDLHAEIAALKAEREWRPIETSPRDGTHIWLYVAGMQTEAWFDPGKPSTDHEGCDNSTGPVWVCADDQWQIEVEWATDEEGNAEYYDGAATHWQPLPLAPEAA